MASPAASEQFVAEQAKKITFRFCREWYISPRYGRFQQHVAYDSCSANMLYPKEDRHNNALMFACRTCPYSEEASTSACVFRNDLSNTVGETAGITQDVGSDPTVGGHSYDGLDFSLPLCSMCGQGIL